MTLGLDSPKSLGTVAPDANGDATFSKVIGQSLAGQTIYLQAVEPASCRVSGVVTTVLD